MRLAIGLFESSRTTDLDRLFREHYPALRVTLVKSCATLRQVDAVLAGGGPDLNPALYGQVNRGCKRVDPDRDARDFGLLHEVLAQGVPYLGLCRGAQLLNVARGGTLYQDLAAERGQPHHNDHTVSFSGVGAAHLGEAAQVNSSHHQGVERLGRGLEIIGTAADGLPEAWHSPGAIGVQFHPETLVHTDAHWLRVFDWWLGGAQ